MKRNISLHWLGLLLSVACLLTACGSSNKEYDETAGWSAQRIYTEAKDEMSDGQWEKAIKLLETLEAKYPFGRYAQQAQMDVAYAQWKNNDHPAAIASCDRFIKLYPNHANLDYIFYLKGLINFNEDIGLFGKVTRQDPTERDNKAARESFDTFKELLVRFPDSKYAPDARLRLKYLVGALAQYEVHVARYYMKRGAYLAAANRAQGVVTVYPGTVAQEEALYILYNAYAAMGLKELSSDAKKVFEMNYPNSTLERDHGPVNNDPWWKIW
jgi:outer membrane protein assembly factor BamD